jgi:hypothetical protein
MGAAAMAFSERNPSRARQLEMKFQARWLERENGRLAQENEKLRQQCADLSASAELWIHLYESALLRVGKGGA